jgi:glycerol-3-phosphate dehydrogenase
MLAWGVGMDRESQVANLSTQQWDLLVIGGGATGAGIILDAASRGLKAALVEKDDFASGTSSRSTKLIHGGVRYLERAVLDLDRSQYALVKEALQERAILLRIAPHLTHFVPLLTPLYHRAEVPYYYAGLKMYDWLAGDDEAPPSRYISAKEAIELCPMLKKENLRGGVVYSDGQFDDARMALSIVLRAVEMGACAVNHAAAVRLTKENGKICGAEVQDGLSGKSLSVRAKVVVNATGPLADHLRQMDDPAVSPLLKASSGSHIVLDPRFSPPSMGLLIPKTEDDRVLFLLPWLGHTLVGTTDNPAEVTSDPKASQEDVAYILRQLKKYFSIAVDQKDILSQWCGLRPLIETQGGVSTAKLSREHAIDRPPRA